MLIHFKISNEENCGELSQFIMEKRLSFKYAKDKFLNAVHELSGP